MKIECIMVIVNTLNRSFQECGQILNLMIKYTVLKIMIVSGKTGWAILLD
jgi:hypothetical protein